MSQLYLASPDHLNVYQLKRLVRVEARKARYLDLVAQWDHIVFAASLLSCVPDKDVGRVANRIAAIEARIRNMLRESQPYTGMLRYMWVPL